MPDNVKTSVSPVARQPYLHDLQTCVRAPAVALSGPDGQIHSGVHGVFWADRRIVSLLRVCLDGNDPVGIGVTPQSAARLDFVAVARELGDTGADPTITVHRIRELCADGLVETITVTSAARERIGTELEVDIACDLAEMSAVKSGLPGVPLPAHAHDGGLAWSGSGGSVQLYADPAPHSVADGTLRWPVTLERGESFSVTVRVTATPAGTPVVSSSNGSVRRREFALDSDDRRFSALVERSLDDLDGLVLADPLDPQDGFLAAGAPWFLTLFGRDSLWAARMLLPLGTEIAAGTLRTLARRQGTVVDVSSAQEPGKIMHEIRAGETTHDRDSMCLPPLYYGTVDATALWVLLLHDAWRAGMADADVARLVPNASRAMEWITDYGAEADGFVSYRDASGHGLANQGWKDSGDSVQFRDGTLASAPIALCEVQGYSYAAAHAAATLGDAFGGGDPARWRIWAGELAGRFRDRFWIDDPNGRFPATALDVDGTRVDSVTSNIAHLLGTGLLDADEERLVVARLARPDMDSGFGLRTMSSTSAGFNPLAYHGGSVWPHDTAIAIGGLTSNAAQEAAPLASSLIAGLLRASPTFDFRLPELFGGHARADVAAPVPYPAACRPQAWAATASIAMLSALLGLRVDVPGRTLTLRPLRPSPVGAFEIRGLRFGAETFGVVVDAHGDPRIEGLAREVRVVIE